MHSNESSRLDNPHVGCFTDVLFGLHKIYTEPNQQSRWICPLYLEIYHQQHLFGNALVASLTDAFQWEPAKLNLALGLLIQRDLIRLHPNREQGEAYYVRPQNRYGSMFCTYRRRDKEVK